MNARPWLWPSALALTAGAALGAAHCSLTVSPSDYTRERAVSDAGNARPVKTVIVAAGVRDRLATVEAASVPTNDVWRASIDSNGVVGAWAVEAPLPILSNARTALVMGNHFYVVSDPGADGSNFHVAVEWIPITERGLGTAWESAIAEVPRVEPDRQYFELGVLLLPSGLVLVGGSANVPTADAGAEERVFPDVIFDAFDANAKTFAPRRSMPPLSLARSIVTTATYKKFLYAIGGVVQTGTVTDAVDVAPIDEASPNGPVGAFAPTAKITDPDGPSGGIYRIITPAVCAGEGALYVIGGTIGSAPSDIVLMARIDESTGQLAKWTRVTKLPSPLDAAGCFTHGGKLYAIGGRGSTTRSAAVISAPMNADGTLGGWDTTSHTPLPVPRSQIAVATY